MPADVITALQENRKPGENPGRYRRCKRGGTTLDESQSLGKPEKAVWKPWMRKSEELLKRGKTRESASTGSVVFCCGKSAAAALHRVAAVFCCDRLRASPGTIALTVTARKPTEYCLSMR